MREVFLGLDQGTTGTAALLFDGSFRVLAEAHVKHRQFYPAPGFVEHDPREIWECSRRAVSLALAKAGLTAGEITAAGLANQGETVIVWDKETGKPVYPAIVWSDRRTAAEAARLEGLYGGPASSRTPISARRRSAGSWITYRACGRRPPKEKSRPVPSTAG
jgi:glycerol kinase